MNENTKEKKLHENILQIITCRKSFRRASELLINQFNLGIAPGDPSFDKQSIKIWKQNWSRSSKKAIYILYICVLSKSSGLMRWNGN